MLLSKFDCNGIIQYNNNKFNNLNYIQTFEYLLIFKYPDIFKMSISKFIS